MLWFWTDAVGVFDPRKVTNNICQRWNKHTWMFCVRELISPELDLILPKLAHAMLKSGWLGCARQWLRIVPTRNSPLPTGPTPLCLWHCGVGTAILGEVGWLSPWEQCDVRPHHEFINIPKTISLLFCLNSDTQWRHKTTEPYENSLDKPITIRAC